MVLSFSLSMPALLAHPATIPAIAGIIVTAAVGYVGYKLYKSIKTYKEVKSYNGEVSDVDTTVKAVKSYGAHKARMAVGALPTWAFFVAGQATNKVFWESVRQAAKKQHFIAYITIYVVSSVGEVAGAMGVQAATAYHPLARQYRVDYKRDSQLCLNLNPRDGFKNVEPIN